MGRACMLTVRHCRSEDGHYRIRIDDPLPKLPTSASFDDCVAISAEVEAMVRACPSQYMWVHRRFKNRPEGEASLY